MKLKPVLIMVCSWVDEVKPSSIVVYPRTDLPFRYSVLSKYLRKNELEDLLEWYSDNIDNAGTTLDCLHFNNFCANFLTNDAGQSTLFKLKWS